MLFGLHSLPPETHHGKEIHRKNGLLGILNMSLLRLVQNRNVKNGITA